MGFFNNSFSSVFCFEMTDNCTFLYSSLATDQIQIVNSRRLEDALIGNKIKFEKIDGSLTENKEVRDKLFAVSNLRGKYPQCFLETDGAFRFLGLWDEIEALIDSDTIPVEVLDANPTIPTFKRVSSSLIMHDVFNEMMTNVVRYL